jgi:hypothetical protein
MLMLAQTARAGACAVLAGLSVCALAATHREVMFSKYMRTQFCIERAVGQRWHEKMNVPLVMNRWGASEPTEAALRKAPEALRQADQRCRAANDLSAEPRPGQ